MTERGVERPCGAAAETARHRACAAVGRWVSRVAKARLSRGEPHATRDRRMSRPFWSYVAWQMPGWLVAVLIAMVLHRAFGVSAWLLISAVVLYVGKDLLLYPAMRAVFRPPAPSLPVGEAGKGDRSARAVGLRARERSAVERASTGRRDQGRQRRHRPRRRGFDPHRREALIVAAGGRSGSLHPPDDLDLRGVERDRAECRRLSRQRADAGAGARDDRRPGRDHDLVASSEVREQQVSITHA